MDAGRAGLTLRVEDMRIEERWPAYAPAAAERGVGSSLSVPLPLQAAVIGAVNIYSTGSHAFDAQEVVELAEEIARLAAGAVAKATPYSSATRRAQAKGGAQRTRPV